MKDLPWPVEFVEKIILETRSRPWVALSIGGCGILTGAMVWRDGYGGGHDENYMGARRYALEFAHRVVCAMGLSAAHERVSTSQILVDAAAALNDGPEHVALLCTTWQYVSEGMEICSVGTNSVLLFEGDGIEEVMIPHSVDALIRSQWHQPGAPGHAMIPTHALGYEPNSCSVDDVRVARVPFLPTTTIAIIKDRRLADDIIRLAVPRNKLPSFIEAWTPPGKRIRTSVLISC